MDRQEAEQYIAKLKSDIISGKQSLSEIIKQPPDGDYLAHVDTMRLCSLLMNDAEVLKALRSEMNAAIPEEINLDEKAVEREIVAKDGRRRFAKLFDYHKEMHETLTPLLSGGFDNRLSTYTKLVSSVERMWSDACARFTARDYPLACFLAILVIEEIGKLSRLHTELLEYDSAASAKGKPIADKDHRRKHFLGVISGAVVNARLDRVLGKHVVRKILHQAESDELEKLRQSCLYIDFVGDKASTPAERIDRQLSQTYVVLAGELMAEVLGYFPWEFRRMQEAVIAFERLIGVPEKKITTNPISN